MLPTRILPHEHGKKVAVIVNELRAVGIDNQRVILCYETDLMMLEGFTQLEQKISAMNTMIKIYPTPQCDIDMNSVFEVWAFEPELAPSINPGFLGEDVHEQDDSVYFQAIVLPASMTLQKLSDWMSLLQATGSNVVWMKGMIDLEDEERCFAFQGAYDF